MTDPRARGYLHEAYVEALREFGTPRRLPASGGWILEREIPGTRHRDAIGCYPLFTCLNWQRLREDLEQLQGELVSLTIVADPLAAPDRSELVRAFPDLARPFKEHY
ncbi:MAG: hypothetical protein ABR599_05105, partial [Gemmatimonadota bacterium]